MQKNVAIFGEMELLQKLNHDEISACGHVLSIVEREHPFDKVQLRGANGSFSHISFPGRKGLVIKMVADSFSWRPKPTFSSKNSTKFHFQLTHW